MILLNEYGKLGIHTFAGTLSFIFFVFALQPFLETCGYVFPSVEISNVSEHLFWFGACAAYYGLFYVVGFIISGLFHYAVYFVTRVWYIRKLHTPERIYLVE